jgi:hypothetical protein
VTSQGDERKDDMDGYLEILDPTADAEKAEGRIAPAASLAPGGSVALLSNGWPAMELLVDELSARLRGDHGLLPSRADIPISTPAAPELLDQVAGRSSAALVGLAN